MPFINEILKYKSVSIVGIEKNTGKTECLNYILQQLQSNDASVAITSIGVDGEQTDRVTATPKPEISLTKGMVFITSEKLFLEKKLIAEILDVSEEKTALGRLITAKAFSEGKVTLSGPSDTAGVRKVISLMQQLGVQTTIIDGALSRMSLASPSVTDAMVLATGAAVSANISQLVQNTAYIKKLIDLQHVEPFLAEKLLKLPKGIWAVDRNGEIHDLKIPSAFLFNKREDDIFRYGTRFYAAGAVSNSLLQSLRLQQKNIELIIHDFSKVFASQPEFDAFIKSGNSIRSITKSKLIAVTINPVSPNGICLNSDLLRKEMEKALSIPVYDIKKMNN